MDVLIKNTILFFSKKVFKNRKALKGYLGLSAIFETSSGGYLKNSLWENR